MRPMEVRRDLGKGDEPMIGGEVQGEKGETHGRWGCPGKNDETNRRWENPGKGVEAHVSWRELGKGGEAHDI